MGVARKRISSGSPYEDQAAFSRAIADGATILQPIGPSQWAPLCGMLKDRFGVTWVLDIAAEY